MRLFFLLYFMLLLPFGASAEIRADIEQLILHKYYQDNVVLYKKSKDSGSIKSCGKYVSIDIASALDGPLYYLNSADGSVYSVCGGACMNPQTPEQIKTCRTKCPPSNLVCSGYCPTWECSVRNNDIESAKKFIGVQNLELKSYPNGSTALNFAARMQYVELVELLVQAGADVNTRDEFGYTPLYNNISSITSKNRIAEILINAGADLDIVYGKEHVTALEQADFVIRLNKHTLGKNGVKKIEEAANNIIDLIKSKSAK